MKKAISYFGRAAQQLKNVYYKVHTSIPDLDVHLLSVLFPPLQTNKLKIANLVKVLCTGLQSFHFYIPGVLDMNNVIALFFSVIVPDSVTPVFQQMALFNL